MVLWIKTGTGAQGSMLLLHVTLTEATWEYSVYDPIWRVQEGLVPMSGTLVGMAGRPGLAATTTHNPYTRSSSKTVPAVRLLTQRLGAPTEGSHKRRGSC